MAAPTDDLIRAIEEQTAATKKQNSLLGGLESALQAAMGTNESLKEAMMKSGQFSEGKMFAIQQQLAGGMADWDKSIKAMNQFLSAGICL